MSAPARPDLDALEKVMTNYRVWGTAYYGNPTEMLALIAYARALEADYATYERTLDALLGREVLALRERDEARAQLATLEARERDEVQARWGLQIEQLARRSERERCAAWLKTTGRLVIDFTVSTESAVDVLAAAMLNLPDPEATEAHLPAPEPHEATS